MHKPLGALGRGVMWRADLQSTVVQAVGDGRDRDSGEEDLFEVG